MERKITALKAQKRNPNRVNVYLDGEFAFGLARIVAAWLTIGQPLSDEEIERLQAEDEQEKAAQTAMHLLSYRVRSEAEVKKKLENKGFSTAVVEQTLQRLRQNGLLDDRQFAQAWVENQSTFRPRGRRLLRLEMRLKGLGEEDISTALDSAADESTLAYKAAARQAERLAGLDRNEFRLKLSQFLARRGFHYSTIVDVVASLWEEVHSSQEAATIDDHEDEV